MGRFGDVYCVKAGPELNVTLSLGRVDKRDSYGALTVMQLTVMHAQTERTWQDRSARSADKHQCRVRIRLLRGLVRSVPAAPPTAGAAHGEKRLSGGPTQAIFTLDCTQLAESQSHIT
jgi:hypothetical protein